MGTRCPLFLGETTGIGSVSEAIYHLSWAGRLVLASAVALGLAWAWRRRPWLSALPSAAGGVLLFFSLTIVAMFLRPSADPGVRQLYEGVTYQRSIRSEPARQVWHVLTVALDTDDLRVFVTPPEVVRSSEGQWQIAARTTSGFLRMFDQQVAVNGSFFYEQTSFSIFYFYPRVGDGVNIVGRAMSDGQVYGDHDPSTWTLWFLPGRARVSVQTEAGAPPADAFAAVSGYPLLREGRVAEIAKRSKRQRHPRVAAGVSADGRTLYIASVDGRQPFYSDGATIPEVAQVLRSEGAFDAVVLDGGGSSSMVWRDPSGTIEQLNRPVHGRMPSGYERPVANHIGFSGLRPVR